MGRLCQRRQRCPQHHAEERHVNMTSHRIATVGLAALTVLICAPHLAHAQYFHVGTFTKPAATGVQTWPHGLPAGVTPAAMIFWTAGDTVENGNNTNGFWWAFGVTDGIAPSATGGSRSVSASSQGVTVTSSASRRSAKQAISIVQYG